MIMPTGVKAIIATMGAIMLWVTTNLGEAFYVLVIAYLVDFALNYANRSVFIPKMFNYLGGVAFAYYLQQGHDFNSIPILHGLIVIIALHEVMEVTNELKSKIATFKENKSNTPALLQSLTPEEITIIESIIDKMHDEATTIANKPTPEELASLALK